MEETQKLVAEIDDLTCRILSEFSAYESYDIAIKILALQEQRETNANLDSIENRLRRIEIILNGNI